MPTITVDVPPGVSPADLGRLAAEVSTTVERTIGLCEVAVNLDDLRHPRTIADIIEELARPSQHAAAALPLERPDVSRAQELAGDAMAAKYGRSAVEHQADGSVRIIGLLDDVAMETVCVEQDGRERWRR